MPESSGSSLTSPKGIAAIVIGVLALIFIFQNTGRGSINFLFWTLTMPAWIWMLVVFAAGFLTAAMLPKSKTKK